MEDAVPVSLCTLDLELRPLLLRRSSRSLRPLQLDIIRHASNSGWLCLEPHCRPSCLSENFNAVQPRPAQLQLPSTCIIDTSHARISREVPSVTA